MRVLIEVEGTSHEVEVAQAADDATLADLVQQAAGLRPRAGSELWVDGRRYDPERRLGDILLLEGSRIGSAPPPRVAPIDDWSVIVSGGLEAGRVVPIPTGHALTVGRGADCDIVVDSLSSSRRHASFERTAAGVRIRDLGSANGTVIDGAKVRGEEGVEVTGAASVLIGGTPLRVVPRSSETLAPAPGSLPNVTLAGTAPFNRPPRPGRRPDPESIPVPTRSTPSSVSSPLGIAVIAGPIVMAGGMVAITHQVPYALMALLSPVLSVGTHVEQKRRGRKDAVKASAGFSEAVEAFKGDLESAAEEERVRRREQTPDAGTTRLRAALPTTKLWQRRASAEDFLALETGFGDVPWTPPLDKHHSGTKPDPEIQAVLDGWKLRSTPVQVDLTGAGVVGIVGPREGALAVARNLLVQAAVHCGPADLTVGVFCDQARHDEWAWTTWLPHVRRLGAGPGAQWFSSQRDRSEAMLRGLREGIDAHATPAALLLIDSEVLTEGRDAPARSLLGHGRTASGSPHAQRETPVAGIVIATTEEHLPAACTTIIRVGEDTAGRVTRLGDRSVADDISLSGLTVAAARDTARDLARFEDPELVVPGGALPALVRLPSLLGLPGLSAEAISASWSRSSRITSPIGIGEGGVFEIDLVRDGPHGLVGGTTGSGKSEFLRSLVAGLAARNDPTKLTFILIDFKGGAAFAACERLPHTIGTVSNLDAQLADRAIRSLEAELRYRQEMFAAAGEGVDNIDAYWATRPAEPMPRLLLVIDEFAMLAKDYPDVLKSLVSVAAVGRTLGVHMILATQRPAGVVNEDILANTNLRVALRVQSKDDSVNVVGVPDASAIGRTQWGRAYVKLGQDDITPVQTALVTGRSETTETGSIVVHPVVAGVEGVPTPASTAGEDDPTDLDLLIDAIGAANDAAGHAAPRPVWPEALGEKVALLLPGAEDSTRQLPAPGVPIVGGVVGSQVQVAIADQPDRQRQIPVGWDLAQGNLMLLGIPGSGTTTTLTSIALTLAGAYSPDDLDLLVLDLGSRDLEPLAALPHTVGYVGSGTGAREQQIRALKHLRAELERRRSTPGPHRRMVVLIDGFALLREEYDDMDGIKMLEGLYRAYADGPDVNLWMAISTARAKAVPTAVDEVTTQKWAFRLADPYDYAAVGLDRREIPPAVPGRCAVSGIKLQAHVGTPMLPVPAAVAQIAGLWPLATPKPGVVGQLADVVTASALVAAGARPRLDAEPWRLPVGIGESDLEPAYLEVYEGEHVLVAGPARSGKSSMLLGIAALLKGSAAASGEPLQIWGLCGRRSPLGSSPLLDRVAVGEESVAPLIAAARVHRGTLVLLIDDATEFADDDSSISDLLSGQVHGLLTIAAGRAEDLRSLYSHWTKAVRKARCGVLLQPDIDYDGDLLSARIPRKAPVAVTVGRGYAVSGGNVAFVQGVSPDA